MKVDLVTEFFLIKQYDFENLTERRKVEAIENNSNNNSAKKDNYSYNKNKGKNYYGKKRRYYTDYC
jgi:hypothetical protein